MVKRINLALQGGGAHGAFTWGVLDRLLSEEDVEVAAITGTSAGALNGAAFKSGMVSGGRSGAREALDWLWGEVGARDNGAIQAWMAPFSLAQFSRALEFSLPFIAADTMSRMVSPYSYGPFYRNPLRPIVDQFDFDKVCAVCDTGLELFICATRVRNGKVRVFKDREISTEAILASACLPTMFQAVEVHDEETGMVEAFWDGGYTGNPALFPLFHPRFPRDIVVVNINPLERTAIPRTAQEIQNRINEISFNSSLLRELRAIEFVQRLVGEGHLKQTEKRSMLVHMIADDELMNELSVATKLFPTPYTLARLKEAGQRKADDFLAHHKADLNVKSSVDLVEMFQ
jgi:NTE family protein